MLVGWAASEKIRFHRWPQVHEKNDATPKTISTKTLTVENEEFSGCKFTTIILELSINLKIEIKTSKYVDKSEIVVNELIQFGKFPLKIINRVPHASSVQETEKTIKCSSNAVTTPFYCLVSSVNILYIWFYFGLAQVNILILLQTWSNTKAIESAVKSVLLTTCVARYNGIIVNFLLAASRMQKKI